MSWRNWWVIMLIMLSHWVTFPQIPGISWNASFSLSDSKHILCFWPLYFSQLPLMCVRAHTCVKAAAVGCGRESLSGFYRILFAYICLSLRSCRLPEEVWWRLRVMSGRHFQLPDRGERNSNKTVKVFICSARTYFCTFLFLRKKKKKRDIKCEHSPNPQKFRNYTFVMSQTALVALISGAPSNMWEAKKYIRILRLKQFYRGL